MAKTFLDSRISVYNGVTDTKGSISTIGAFLNDTRYIDEIKRLRTLTNKDERNAVKKRLPMACISGIFEPTRKAENLKQHSGLICVDLDRQDNLEVSNWDEVKHQLSYLRYVAYCGLSVGGNGYFAIMPILYPYYHKQQFEALKRDFQRYGLVIDKACGDVCRMRCVSYDPEPYINLNADPYRGYYKEPVAVYTPIDCGTDGELDKVAKCCDLIQNHGIDITGDYLTWFEVGCALASLGESRRAFYHVCSQQNPKYSKAETDRKFDNVKKTCSRIGIGTFFRVCKDYGITFKDA